MTTRRRTSFTVGAGRAVAWEGTALVQMDAGYVPTLLHRMEVYKHRFAYPDAAAWATGWYAVTAQQEALLMDIGDRLLAEVRALRNGSFTDEVGRDLTVDPFTLALPTLGTVQGTIGFYGDEHRNRLDTANTTLAEIRDLLTQQGGGEGIIERLDMLIFLLGAA